MKRPLTGKIYYGWVIVFLGFLLMAVSWGVVYNTASLFIVPISEELGFTRSQISFTMTLRALTQTLMALSAGKIYRKVPIEASMKLMSLLLVASFYGLGISRSLWQFYLFTVTSSLANSFLGIIPLSLIISNWFLEKRGSALGFAFMGSGIGGMIFSSLAGNWIAEFGWGKTYHFLALIMLIMVVPIAFFFMKEKPEKLGMRPYGEKENTVESTQGIPFQQALGLPLFWILGAATFAVSMAIHVLMVSVAPHLASIGYSFKTAANMLAMVMGSLALGKLLLGYLFDRFPLRVGISLSLLGSIMGLVGLLYGKHTLALVLIVLGSGIGSAYGTIADPIITRSIFGRKDYATIYGIYAALGSLGGVIAPLFHGRSFDRTGSYQEIILWAAILAGAVLLVNQWIFSKHNLEKLQRRWE